MNRFMLSALLCAATVCAVPGFSSADPWAAPGPASAAFNYNGYIDPWTGRAGNGAYDTFPRLSNYTTFPRSWAPSRSDAPIWNSYPQQTARTGPAQAASVQVRVPANAEIWFDNLKTSQTGTLRTFASPPLETGKTFIYAVHVRWTDSSGKVIDLTKKVEVRAGELSSADFTGESASSKGVRSAD